MKSYTDLEQSKKLAEILPLETADMKWYFWKEEIVKLPTFGYSKESAEFYKETEAVYLPCWSLASLLDVLPNYNLQTLDDGIGILCSCEKFNIVTSDNPVDACVTMIETLHGLKML